MFSSNWCQWFYSNSLCLNSNVWYIGVVCIGLGLWYLTPLLTIFQLYRGGQFSYSQTSVIYCTWQFLFLNLMSIKKKKLKLKLKIYITEQWFSLHGVSSIAVYIIEKRNAIASFTLPLLCRFQFSQDPDFHRDSLNICLC